ncbi:alpha/beta hydrolase [Spirosoma agri]|uniref:Alpha/beta hydrolase n=1 Tax=Spirosoma agri TaxID=1987381 RepID=A0A6M0IPX1_9BACT|nr:alpha/beta hydrolase-fold protein [Spirosoma agri]NEU70379.1 alpha/beta hydrolase [Spirosoma agri]
MKTILYLLCLVLVGCQPKSSGPDKPSSDTPLRAIYSRAVNDSLYVQTQLPLEYDDSTTKHYPVVVILDGNFHFPMLAASVHQYEKAGLLPPLILVGVGYRSFNAMDSLRVRDYLYPAALASDELKAPGGGERFRQFLSRELVPSIDSTYRTTSQNRTLLGHSFGGYFALYTLLSQAKTKTHDFQNFVAASPSVWYHNFYLNQLPAQLSQLNKADSIRLFLSVGGQENPQWDIKPVSGLTTSIRQSHKVSLQGGVYDQLGHMDTGQLSFLKGLQYFYQSR